MKILNYFNLDHHIEDFDTIHETIEKDIIFKGSNLWILVFAIIIASVGLNINSTAVIIGAMLISPLMGPINGMGYSLATYNFPLFRQSIKNFTFAVVASLIASTIYFAISPISSAHSELLARTSPTIYDVIIALFGGLAGIVAIISKKKGNVIPGVAIATALMPPLCTAGYGLATAQFIYFFGAVYLFTINTVFIAISSVAISQILKFPIRTVVEESQRRRINHWISLVIIITVIPSIYFGYRLVQKEKFTENATRFVNSVLVIDGNYQLQKDINPAKRIITLVYGGNSLTEADKNTIKDRAKDFSLDDVAIIIRQGFSFNDLNKNTTEVDKLKSEINQLTLLLKEKENQQNNLTKNISLGKQLLSEINTVYPQITSCSYAETFLYKIPTYKPEKITYIAITHKGRLLNYSERKKINAWLKTRLNNDSIKTFFD